MIRHRTLLAALGLFTVTACGQINTPGFLKSGDGSTAPSDRPLDATAQPGSGALSDAVRDVVTAPPPSAAARTAEDFDTTTDDQRAAATASAPTAAGETRLGETVASLGDPTQPGFWIKSPLVKTAGPGRLENPSNGKTALVELIPLPGEAGGGSQVSLAALRVLDAPITDLPTLVVYTE
ncbi:hypothetical protein [Oceaniglobus indicus]|uniref:hypothetical protein n=1 Tax=Oceaniglobus indicus TaxID=2047749 RepID=UPI00147648CB|nr:hypothetical protein [Oceaniglobus indicus]